MRKTKFPCMIDITVLNYLSSGFWGNSFLIPFTGYDHFFIYKFVVISGFIKQEQDPEPIV